VCPRPPNPSLEYIRLVAELVLPHGMVRLALRGEASAFTSLTVASKQGVAKSQVDKKGARAPYGHRQGRGDRQDRFYPMEEHN